MELKDIKKKWYSRRESAALVLSDMINSNPDKETSNFKVYGIDENKDAMEACRELLSVNIQKFDKKDISEFKKKNCFSTEMMRGISPSCHAILDEISNVSFDNLFVDMDYKFIYVTKETISDERKKELSLNSAFWSVAKSA